MSTRDEVLDTITRLFWHVDHHEWEALADVFADRVDLDYTSLQGGQPTTLAPADIIDGWRTHFDTMDAHQHLVANHLVDVRGDAATTTAAFIATHQTGEETWTLGGDYHFALVRHAGQWKVVAMTMTAVWQRPGGPPRPPV